MKRLARCILTSCSAASLLLFIVTGVLWEKSDTWASCVMVLRPDRVNRWLELQRGWVAYSHCTEWNDSPFVWYGFVLPDKTPPVPKATFGFGVGSDVIPQRDADGRPTPAPARESHGRWAV